MVNHKRSNCFLGWLAALMVVLTAVGVSAQPADPLVVDTILEIPDVYAGIDTLVGVQVQVIGEYVSPGDSKLVTEYGEYAKDELMPPSSILFVDGVLPDSLYWYGGVIVVTGTISFVPDPEPVYPQDSLLITITATSYEYLIEGLDLPDLPPAPAPSPDSRLLEPTADCDSCKFAILVSGGGNAAHNKPTYWQNIEMLYNHKINFEGYCPENIHVVYFEGNSGNTALIPDSLVARATQANIDSVHQLVARKVAMCSQDSIDATVQKMFTNHGADNSGVVLLGNERLSPTELRDMQQMLIDSCAKYIYDEFIECYGGDMVNGMKGLDDMGKTEIHANSASGESSVGWSPREGGHVFLRKKIEMLEDSIGYECAVDSARARYSDYLMDIVDTYTQRVADMNAIIAILPDGALKDYYIAKRDKYQHYLDLANASKMEGSPSFVRYQFDEYCEWQKIKAPQGGQFKFTFKTRDQGGCGNVTIWSDFFGFPIRMGTWNWNLPGSIGYLPGNDMRVLNVPLSWPSRTYWIHNDNGDFTVTVETRTNQDEAETPFNPDEFAGFSVGGTDGSSAEFSVITGSVVETFNTEAPGFSTQNVPALLGEACAGAGQYIAHFNKPVHNPWWDNVQIEIVALSLTSATPIQVNCDICDSTSTTFMMPGPGKYEVPLGSVSPSATSGSISFTVLSAACLELDSWGLRSLVPTVEAGCCDGRRGDVNLTGTFPTEVDSGDLGLLVSYLFSPPGSVELPCIEEADLDASGGANPVDSSDLGELVNFLFAPPGSVILETCP